MSMKIVITVILMVDLRLLVLNLVMEKNCTSVIPRIKYTLFQGMNKISVAIEIIYT